MRRIAIALALCLVIPACQKREEPAADTIDAVPAEATTTTAAPVQTAPAAQPLVQIPPDVPIPKDGVALWLNADDSARIRLEGGENAPMVVQNVINGHAVLRFDGENDMIETDVDIGPARAPNVTVCSVFSSRTAEPSPLRKLYGNDNGGYDRAVGLDDRASEANYTIFAGESGVVGYFMLEAGKVYLTCDKFSADKFQGFVDGKQAADATAKWDEALPNLYVGGTGTSYNELWQGDLAEMIVYLRALSDPERVQVEDYLAGKYGITLQRQ